jgi:hypothetical protein
MNLHSALIIDRNEQSFSSLRLMMRCALREEFTHSCAFSTQLCFTQRDNLRAHFLRTTLTSQHVLGTLMSVYTKHNTHTIFMCITLRYISRDYRLAAY